MKRGLVVLAALLTSGVAAQEPAPAEPPRLSLEQRMLLRCAASFALVANRQQAGEQWALAYPPLDERGRAFFVRSGARVMDEAALDTAALDRILAGEAQDIVANDQIPALMPICLDLLEQSGL